MRESCYRQIPLEPWQEPFLLAWLPEHPPATHLNTDRLRAAAAKRYAANRAAIAAARAKAALEQTMNKGE